MMPIESKINWEYYHSDYEFNLNPTYDQTDFIKVDCLLFPKIIYWDSANINFDKNLKFDWSDQSLGDSYLQKVLFIRDRCPNVKIAIDPQFEWNEETSTQILAKSSIQNVTQSLLDFNLRYKSLGMVVTFRGQAAADHRHTIDFFEVILISKLIPVQLKYSKINYLTLKCLNRMFMLNNLTLIGYFPRDELAFSNVKPEVFQ